MKKNLCIGTGALMAGLLLSALTAAAQPQPKTWSITPKVGVAVSSVTGHPGPRSGWCMRVLRTCRTRAERPFK